MPSSKARKLGTEQGAIGHLVWFSVPAVKVDFDVLKDLAADVGLEKDWTPSPPTPKDAWRKATNTGKRGIQVPQIHMDTWKLQQAKERKLGQPRAFLRTVEISRSAPLLVRHLVLFVVQPNASGKDEQLELGTVAVMEFDTETNRGRFDVTAWGQDWISSGYVHNVVQDMLDEVHNLAYNADNNRIRSSIRDMLEAFHRVCVRNTGGVYFVPKSTACVTSDGTVVSANDALEAMKQWMDRMGPYAVDPEEAPMFRRVLLEGANASELRDDIVTSAVAEFKDGLQAIAESLEPVLAGRAKGRTAEGIAENAVAALGSVVDAANAYRKDLDMELTELENMFRMAHQAVKQAKDVTTADTSDFDLDDIMDLLAD